jgi:acetyl coenzyme A synthetase (ADP forming)-like protein
LTFSAGRSEADVVATGGRIRPDATVVLRDGSTVSLRPVRPDDGPPLARFLAGLSTQSRYFRFFSPISSTEQLAQRLVSQAGFGLIAVAGPERDIVAHAHYATGQPGRAEVAFAIADSYQGRGLGTILLGQLAEAAHDAGIPVLEGVVLPENRRMLDVFRESGFQVRSRSDRGEVRIEFDTAMSTSALERFDARDQIAAVAAVSSLLAPASVALIGASRQLGTIGGETFHNLVTSGFTGPVYPVNQSATVVQSVAAYPSIADIPGPVELAVIAVPAEEVPEIARQCAAKGVRGLVVISAGFAEVGPDGRRLQSELLGVCREAGMRLIGPNCMGLLNTAPGVRLNATFAPVFPPEGRVAFMSQSGGLGLAVIDFARSLGLGISSFVSAGNKADISGNDLIQYWETDPDTDVILLYLESFGNPRRFARLARRVARAKSIIAVKSGRSTAGTRATTSHTGGLVSASDATVDALFSQAGVIRTDTLGEMFDAATFFGCQPVPPGGRVGIVTNAGGPAVLCADACAAHGLDVPPPSERLRVQLAELLPPEAALSNPIDMIASATPEQYEQVIGVLAQSGEVDALVAIFTPPLVTRAEDVAASIRQAAARLARKMPIVTVFMSARGTPAELASPSLRIPSYAFPEDAARVLAHAATRARWLAEPVGVEPELSGIDRQRSSSIVADALEADSGWMPPEAARDLLESFGLPLVATEIVKTPKQAAAAAQRLGDRIALKAIARGLIHKSDFGAVELDLDGKHVTSAATAMGERMRVAGFEIEGFLVQRMIPPGVEMLVGVVHDRLFGPVVAVAAGGTQVELLKDVSVRITPLTDVDARAMIRSLATFPLLDGYRGAARADVGALESILLRVSALVEAHPEVAELDLNPVVVGPDGAAVVDFRIRLESPEPRIRLGART